MRREAGGERQQAAENERAEVDEHLNHLGASVPRTSAGGFGEPIRLPRRDLHQCRNSGCAAGVLVEYDIDTGLYEHLYPREPTSRV